MTGGGNGWRRGEEYDWLEEGEGIYEWLEERSGRGIYSIWEIFWHFAYQKD